MEAGKRALIVTLSGERAIQEVVKDLKAAGLDVGQVLEFTGTVTGAARPDLTDKLRRIAGVADISEDHPVDIGPPGSPVS